MILFLKETSHQIETAPITEATTTKRRLQHPTEPITQEVYKSNSFPHVNSWNSAIFSPLQPSNDNKDPLKQQRQLGLISHNDASRNNVPMQRETTANVDSLLPEVVYLVFPNGINNPLFPVDNIDQLFPHHGGLFPEKSPFSTVADLRGHVPSSQLSSFVREMRVKLRNAGTISLPKQEEEVSCRLMSRGSFLDFIDAGLSPQLYSTLLEKNCILAAMVLCYQLELPDDALYLNVLLCQNPSRINRIMNSLRVVYEVVQRISSYKPFLRQFIHTTFEVCSQIQEYFSQLQVARLICVFILELWHRAQILPTDDISYEIQSFAVTWIQVKEAASLFRAMKTSSAQ